MIDTLKQFTAGTSLFEATSDLLAKLHIEFDRETAEPIEAVDFFETMPAYLTDALQHIEHTYFIGIVNDQSLAGAKTGDSLSDITETVSHGGKYDGMFVFACDAKAGANLTRTQSSALTRAFNRIAAYNPVILVIRQDNFLSLATCERTDYTQSGRQGAGEKIGKVSILRNIDCNNPHRGHVDILESLGDKSYPTFEELYKHWMEVFSSELLTKKFYNELSDWYAWAVQIVRFPNDLHSNDDDAKYNHEACIRLITRLIFVWFLKQKKLIPEEFFDEDYIRDNFIENFNPHDRQNLLYNTEQSKYYRLILQNLFFAMLNCPIVAEGKTTPNNRRFRGDGQKGYVRDGYNVNNLMRYKSEFAENGGADKFMKLANRSVPFLNGGLFDCLDKKTNDLYYDGFSERKESLEQLFFPDYLFFGEEVDNGIDLSQWYDDKKKKNVSARGIIDILKRYSFTIEENTPYDQEVSLDPELLGKVFENLLAAYNPETKQTARKQTGSFYTPREIVQYMVDESLVAHLKRVCGDDNEQLYRSLLSYSTDGVELTDDLRKSIMKAIYNCRVLDPACGSGAFPMGVLQQMVHVLKRIDPTNEMWNELMVDIAIQDAKKELEKVASGNAAEKAKIEENRQVRLADIENAFNQSVNDPDYARKLYLIERCVYGVDIQPIATQISKLRFFISLVVDQKPTKDAKTNFGIRPLPNLEAKFVTANTLIPLDRSRDLFTASEDIRYYEEQLQDINHRIFTAKKNTVKRKLQQDMISTRMAMAQTMENLGAIGSNGYNQLIGWDPFDQNASASFFDPEWMFGVKGGFDIVIANPPYISAPAQVADPILKEQREWLVKSGCYETLYQKWDLYVPFMELGIKMLAGNGSFSMIVPFPLSNQLYGQKFRKWIVEKANVYEIVDLNGTKVFENATVSNLILFATKGTKTSNTIIAHIDELKKISHAFVQPLSAMVQDKTKCVWNFSQQERDTKLHSEMNVLGDYCYISKGMVLNADEKKAKGEFAKDDLTSEVKDEIHCREYIEAKDIEKYNVKKTRFLEYNTPRCPEKLSRPTFRELYERDKIVINRLGSLQAVIDNQVHYLQSDSSLMALLWNDLSTVENKSIKASIKRYSRYSRVEMEKLSQNVCLEYLLAILNSKYAMTLLANQRGDDYHIYPEHLRNLPIAAASKEIQEKISSLVYAVIDNKKNETDTSSFETEIDHLVYHLYNLTYDEVLIVDPSTPITREEYDNFKLD